MTDDDSPQMDLFASDYLWKPEDETEFTPGEERKWYARKGGVELLLADIEFGRATFFVKRDVVTGAPLPSPEAIVVTREWTPIAVGTLARFLGGNPSTYCRIAIINTK